MTETCDLHGSVCLDENEHRRILVQTEIAQWVAEVQ